MILSPFPHVAVDIMHPHGGGREHIDGLHEWKFLCN